LCELDTFEYIVPWEEGLIGHAFFSWPEALLYSLILLEDDALNGWVDDDDDF
jgi:hypothetical protein